MCGTSGALSRAASEALQQRINAGNRVPAARAGIGVPFGPWTAHVVQFRPIGVEQGLGQTLEELDDVEGELRILALNGELANYGRCPDHGGTCWAACPYRLIPAFVGHRAERSGSMTGQLVGLNLGKIFWRRRDRFFLTRLSRPFAARRM